MPVGVFVYVSVLCAHGGQGRALELLELELQVVACPRYRCLERTSSALRELYVLLINQELYVLLINQEQYVFLINEPSL